MSKIADERRQCTSKIPYQTQRQALTQIKRARSRRFRAGPTVPTTQHEPYHCPWCGLWHIGRKTKPHRKRRAARNREKSS